MKSSIEEVKTGIFRIGVPLAGSPLKEINAYFIRGEESDLLIDTAFRTKECEEALKEGLKELGSREDKLSVYVTHLHADHSGLADCIVGAEGKILISEQDLLVAKQNSGMAYADKDRRFIEEGFTEEMLAGLEHTSPSNIYIMKHWELPNVQAVKEGDVICVGDYTLKVILVPGHTPGNTMLWDEEKKLMFTGDHILFDITPNITFWECMEDALGSYIDSLNKVKEYPVEIVLPGHRTPGNYHERIEQLLLHHEQRVSQTYSLVCKHPGYNASQIAGLMSWKIRASSWEDFPLVQKRFAVGEAISHLDYLRLRGKIARRMEDGTLWRYYPI